MDPQLTESRVRGPPGLNTRSHPQHSAADLQVLKEIDHVYFSDPKVFDAARFILEKTESLTDCEAIENSFAVLKRQQQVVSGKALHLISQQRDFCNREFNEIQNMREILANTLDTCRDARNQLNMAKSRLTTSTFDILANFRKREVLKSVLKALELLKQLRDVEKEVNILLSKSDFEEAIALILKCRKDAANHKEFSCMPALTSRLQDTLAMTEEKLDMILASLCRKFDESTFCKLRHAYALLGKNQAAMEQLHMHYSSAINEIAFDAIKSFVPKDVDAKLNELCQMVPITKASHCLLNLCENLFQVMRSYYLLVDWHTKHDEDDLSSDSAMEFEKNLSREYIRQKLKTGLVRIWHDVQGKVSIFLKNAGLEEFPFEKFIQVLGILRRLTQVAEVFCGDTSKVLRDFIKTQSLAYIQNYHKGRMEELRLFLENEGWEPCPVKSGFTILNLQEFKPFKKNLKPNFRSDVSIATSKTISDGTSSVASQDDSVYICKYFNSKTTHTPFEMFKSDTISADDMFGLEQESPPTTDSEDESDELKKEFLDDSEVVIKESPKDSVIVTNTTLSLLRNCGQYLQMCRYLQPISLEVIMLMNQLFDYYFYTVHLFFTSDLDVSKTTLYTTKLNAVLKRISNNILNSGNTYASSEIPPHIDLLSEETLHGLPERVVAMESLLFLTKQYEILQPYLESIVANHQKMILELFKDNTLVIAQDMRLPIYMASASKSFNAKSVLISMSQVKWDLKEVSSENSPYVDLIIRQIQVFALRLENVSEKVPLTAEVLSAVWSMVAKFVMHLLVEGFSNATKCSNAGRGLMQLDFIQILVKLEKISLIKPVPYQEYVDRYVKAYYLPRNSLEDFIKEKIEYSNKHLLALVSCSCENKRDRQELVSIIENREL